MYCKIPLVMVIWCITYLKLNQWKFSRSVVGVAAVVPIARGKEG